MASSTPNTPQMPIYKQADFECGRCDSVWQANYSDIANLRKQIPIHCKNCDTELTMAEDELQLINERFTKSEKVSKRTIIFIIPYFLLCGVSAIKFGGIGTFIMLLIGFMIIVTIRRSLTELGIDHFHLIPVNAPKNEPTKTKRKKN